MKQEHDLGRIDVGRLGSVTTDQLEAALRRFDLGDLRSAAAIPFGLFGQNVFVEASSGSYVLRFGAHYDWQFPTEQFFCNLIHERTDVPVPWPYQWEPSSEIFGYRWGYVLMPRLPGIATANPEVYDRLAPSDREGIARALGHALQQLHRVNEGESGVYDSKTQQVKPFRTTYVQRSIDRIIENAQATMAHRGGALTADEWVWLEQQTQTVPAPSESLQSVLVHEDFNTNNACFENHDGIWKLSGLFDFMSAHFGEGLADLPRQFNMYVEEDPRLAATYLRAYIDGRTLEPDALARLCLYLLDERMIVWEFFHRPVYVHKWRHGNVSFREWFSRYSDALEDAAPKLMAA